MTKPTRRVATYEDLLRVPDHLVAEIINGELITSPRPAPRHAQSSSRLTMVVGGPFDLGAGGPGGWQILDEPELHLGRDVLVPDLAGWRRERMPDLPETAWFELPPDWVCEVLSPSTARIDRKDKLPIFARAGIPFAWLIDPLIRTLEVLRLREERWLIEAVYGGEDKVRAAPFDAVELDLLTLWGEVRQTPPAAEV